MFPNGPPGRIVQAWRNASFELVLSEAMLTEIARVLDYPKIHRRIRWDRQRVDRFILLLRFFSDIVDPAGIAADVPTDPDDASVLATFIAGNAAWLVSGDRDLLALADRYSIVTPAQFWERCG